MYMSELLRNNPKPDTVVQGVRQLTATLAPADSSTMFPGYEVSLRGAGATCAASAYCECAGQIGDMKSAVTVGAVVVVGVSLRVFSLKRHTAVSDGGTGRRLGKPSRAGDRGHGLVMTMGNSRRNATTRGP
jgi:hypothetical protein